MTQLLKLYWLQALCIALIAQGWALQLWPHSTDDNGHLVFRHRDEVAWAVRLGYMAQDPALLAPLPAFPHAMRLSANPHTMYSAWPAVRIGTAVGIDRVKLPAFVRIYSQVALFLASVALCYIILLAGKLHGDNSLMWGSAILWGSYLSLDPGLAHLKPFISTLLGRGGSDSFVGFDRLVSPSTDIVVFVLSLAACIRFFHSPPSNVYQAMLMGAVASLGLLLAPYYFLTIALVVLFLSAARVPNKEWRAALAQRRHCFAVMIISGLPCLVVLFGKWLSMHQIPHLDEFLARNWMIPHRMPDWSFFTRTITLLLATGIAVGGLVAWKKRRHYLLILPVFWTLLAFLAYNQHVATRVDVQNFHFDWPVGYLMGVSLFTMFLFAVPKYIYQVGLLAVLLATVGRTLVSADAHGRYIEQLASPGQVEIQPQTFRNAEALFQSLPAAVRKQNLPFVAPHPVVLAYSFVSGRLPLNSWLSVIYPYSDNDVYGMWIDQFKLTGEDPVKAMPLVTRVPNRSAWPYGLPGSIPNPGRWFLIDRETIYQPLINAAVNDVSAPYNGPLPIVVIRNTNAHSDSASLDDYTIGVFQGDR